MGCHSSKPTESPLFDQPQHNSTRLDLPRNLRQSWEKQKGRRSSILALTASKLWDQVIHLNGTVELTIVGRLCDMIVTTYPDMVDESVEWPLGESSSLGEGSYGEVYRVGFDKAMKIQKIEFCSTWRELKIMLSLNKHPNVVGLSGIVVNEKHVGIVMQLARSTVEKELRLGIFDPTWILDMYTGVNALHEAGWIHHDIKPANMLIMDDGRVSLCDFGVSTATTIPKDWIWCSRAYRPPNRKCSGVDGDWWSVGCCVVKIVCRANLFHFATDPEYALARELFCEHPACILAMCGVYHPRLVSSIIATMKGDPQIPSPDWVVENDPTSVSGAVVEKIKLLRASLPQYYRELFDQGPLCATRLSLVR